MLLSYNELCLLVDTGVIITDKKYVNSSSIDVHLGSDIMVESSHSSTIDPTRPNPHYLSPVKLTSKGYLLRPGSVFLGVIKEKMILPNNIQARFVSKSSNGRVFLNHLHSDLADPGYEGYLTLEMINHNQNHSIRVKADMPIGQLIFTRVASVPDHIMYNNVGQYNNDSMLPVPSLGAKSGQ